MSSLDFRLSVLWREWNPTGRSGVPCNPGEYVILPLFTVLSLPQLVKKQAAAFEDFLHLTLEKTNDENKILDITE